MSKTPKFERRHYNAVAQTLSKCPVYTGGNAKQLNLSVQQMECVIERFVEMFEADNAHFKPGLFRDACAGGARYVLTLEGEKELERGAA